MGQETKMSPSKGESKTSDAVKSDGSNVPTQADPLPVRPFKRRTSEGSEALQPQVNRMAKDDGHVVLPDISKKASVVKLQQEPSTRAFAASSNSATAVVSSPNPSRQEANNKSREMTEKLKAFNATSSPRPDRGLQLAPPINDQSSSSSAPTKKTNPSPLPSAKKGTSADDQEMLQAKMRAMGGYAAGISKHVSAAKLQQEPSTKAFAASSNSSRVVVASPETAEKPKAFNATSSPRPDGGLQLAPPIDDQSSSPTKKNNSSPLPSAKKRTSADDQEMLQAKMRAMGGYVAGISKHVSAAKLQQEPSTNASGPRSDGGLQLAPPIDDRPSVPTTSKDDSSGRTSARSRETAIAEKMRLAQGQGPSGIAAATKSPEASREAALAKKLGMVNASPIGSNTSNAQRTSDTLSLAPPLDGGNDGHSQTASNTQTNTTQPPMLNASRSAEIRKIQEYASAHDPNLNNNEEGPSDNQSGMTEEPGGARTRRERSGEDRRATRRTQQRNDSSDLNKNALTIDIRAAPQEPGSLVDPRSSLHGTNNDDALLEAFAATGAQFTSVERNNSASTIPRNDSFVPPRQAARAPPQGYTVHAGEKGRGEDFTTTRDGGLPGAVAVTQRAIGSRPAWNNSGTTGSTPGSSQGLSLSASSHTAQGFTPSPRQTSIPQGIAPSPSQSPTARVPNQSATARVPNQSEVDESNIPPEMRMARISRLFPIISRNSRSRASQSSENEDDDKDADAGCLSRNLVLIIIAGVVLVIGVGAGLAFGLGGGGDDSPIATSTANTSPTMPSRPTNSPTRTPTMTPTVDADFSFFQKFIEDLNDDPSIFQDPRAPQYRAMAWLTRDPQNLLLSAERIRILYALVVFYYSTNGPNFLTDPTWDQQVGFLESMDACSWNGVNQDSGARMGVFCDSAQRVQSLYFASNNLVGSLPKEIGALTDLENVLFGFNALSSSLPSSLFELGKLAIVDFSTNKLSGTIPDSLSQATLLHTLHLGNNQLEGPISLDVFGGNSACPLELLVLAENKFTGTFPFESIGMNCSSLHSLNLESSGFAAGGTFPTTGLEQLTVLDLRQMGLGGTIPDSISRLSLLKKLELDFNDFRGPIPEIIGQLTTLTELSLSNNRLEGAIPPILGQLQQLTILDLRTNLFSGTLPTELALLPNLERAHFESNFLSGDMEMFCPRDTTGTSRLTILSSDCSFDGIVCSCCTECF